MLCRVKCGVQEVGAGLGTGARQTLYFCLSLLALLAPGKWEVYDINYQDTKLFIIAYQHKHELEITNHADLSGVYENSWSSKKHLSVLLFYLASSGVYVGVSERKKTLLYSCNQLVFFVILAERRIC